MHIILEQFYPVYNFEHNFKAGNHEDEHVHTFIDAALAAMRYARLLQA